MLTKLILSGIAGATLAGAGGAVVVHNKDSELAGARHNLMLAEQSITGYKDSIKRKDASIETAIKALESARK